MSEKVFDIQYFADEAITEEAGEPSAPDAGEHEKENTEKPDFDELIKGDYREEYGKRVSEVIKKRLKENSSLEKDMKQLRSAIGSLGQSLGIEADKTEDIILELKKRIGKDDVSSNAQGADPDDDGKDTFRTDTLKMTLDKLIRGCAYTKEFYPGFDIARELKDPGFRAMLAITGNDPKKSFEILHHDEIIASAVQDAARRTEEKLAGSIASRAQRPSEGATENTASIYIDNDPRSLTRAQRADIKKRVRRGERITW